MATSSRSLCSSKRLTCVTSGSPWVSVPVLSNTIVCRRAVASRYCPPLMSTPARAARAMAAIMAVGVASISAHGQATINTVIARAVSCVKTKTNTDSVSITGTSQPARRSSERWMGASRCWACSTNCAMRARVVSSPTRCASTISAPVSASVPTNTSSPSLLSTGMLSPVTGAWFTDAIPLCTTPSTGTRSPARTTTTSPTCNSDAATSSSFPSRRTRALGGTSDSKLPNERRARRTVYSSSCAPSNMMKATSPAATNSPTDDAAMMAMATSTSASSRFANNALMARRQIGYAPRTTAIITIAVEMDAGTSLVAPRSQPMKSNAPVPMTLTSARRAARFSSASRSFAGMRAVYPARLTASINNSSAVWASDRSIEAVLETKLTDTFSTPGRAASAFSTALAQLAHDMPSIWSFTVFIFF